MVAVVAVAVAVVTQQLQFSSFCLRFTIREHSLPYFSREVCFTGITGPFPLHICRTCNLGVREYLKGILRKLIDSFHNLRTY